jgi:hypothetical protein
MKAATAVLENVDVFSIPGEAQRDPALKLAAAMIDNYGIEWLLRLEDEQFLLLLVNLATIEVRMILESGSMDSQEVQH